MGKVVKKNKPKSIHKNVIIIRMEDGTQKNYDVVKDIADWKDAQDSMDDQPEVCCFHSLKDNGDILHDTFATVLTKAQVQNRPDAPKVMDDEIRKFKSFDAFEEVEDTGQFVIKTRWVYTEHSDDSKGYTLKARLCMMGDREKDVKNIRADSPTAHKDSLKLVLAIAANENFEIFSGDIKSAFLQAQSLQRNVYVLPPPEAGIKGKLWRLKKAAYGLIDGSRLFYLQLKNQLEKLGLKNVSGDPAVFSYHKAGKLEGMVCLHVDDLLMVGRPVFKRFILGTITEKFKFSKLESDKFKYLGCELEKLSNGDISLNQTEYLDKIEEVECPSKSNSAPANEMEKKTIRRVVGELLWVSLMTRPDLSFEVNRLSSNITNASIKDLKDAKKLVQRAKSEPIRLNFTKLGPYQHLKIKLFTDASFSNQDNKLRSTGGRVIALENEKSEKSNIFSWKTKKIPRICRSVKGAETRALEEGLDEAVHFARMVTEIYEGTKDLKNPKQISVDAKTDNKSLWENLNNTRQCEEKLLRNSIALIKEMVDCKEVRHIDWVDTTAMLADSLTKQGGNSSWIRSVISTNII